MLNIIVLFIGVIELESQPSEEEENQILSTLSIQCILHRSELQNTQQYKQSLEKTVEESLKEIDNLNTLNLTQNAWNELLMKCETKCKNPIDENLLCLPIKPHLKQLKTIEITTIIQNINEELRSLHVKYQDEIKRTLDSQILLNNEERELLNQTLLQALADKDQDETKKNPDSQILLDNEERELFQIRLQALADKARQACHKQPKLGQRLRKSFNKQKKEIETSTNDLEKKIEKEDEIRRRTIEITNNNKLLEKDNDRLMDANYWLHRQLECANKKNTTSRRFPLR